MKTYATQAKGEPHQARDAPRQLRDPVESVLPVRIERDVGSPGLVSVTEHSKCLQGVDALPQDRGLEDLDDPFILGVSEEDRPGTEARKQRASRRRCNVSSSWPESAVR